MVGVRELFVPDRQAIAITSMARVGATLYLGLTGGARALAMCDTRTGRVTLGPEVFPWVKPRGYCTKIHNALGALADGTLLLGEGNHFTWDGLPVTVDYFNRELPESMLARKRAQGYPDVRYTDFCLESLRGWDRARCDPGGCLVRHDPRSGASEVVARLPPYLYAQSMIVDAARGRAFGHTLPDNRFFAFDLAARRLKDYGRISDFAHHNLVVTPAGVVYGGWADKAANSVKLLKFDPEQDRLEHLDTVILPDYGRAVAGNRGIDQWLVTRAGDIYMGTVADAALMRFDARAERFETVAVLGQGGRITSMDEDEAGAVWIGTGYPHMRLARYEPGAGRLTDYGRVNDRYERCYFHASCYYEGRLYLGETDGFVPSLHVVELGAVAAGGGRTGTSGMPPAPGP
jgi:hypothetical protein